jgi:hypothetical protein
MIERKGAAIGTKNTRGVREKGEDRVQNETRWSGKKIRTVIDNLTR